MLREAGFVELLDHQRIDLRRRGQIEQPVAVELVGAVEFLQSALQLFECFRMVVLPSHVGKGMREFFALVFVCRAGIRELLYGIDRRLLECLVGHRCARKANDREPPRQAILRRQAVERRNQFPASKISRSAENYDRAGIRRRDRALLGGFDGFGNVVFARRHCRILTFLRRS